MADVCCAIPAIVNRERNVSATTDTRDNIATGLRTNRAIGAIPDRRAAHVRIRLFSIRNIICFQIVIVVRDIIIVVLMVGARSAIRPTACLSQCVCATRATRGRIALSSRANHALADQLAPRVSHLMQWSLEIICVQIETVALDIIIAIVRVTAIACCAIRPTAHRAQCVCATLAIRERIALSSRAKHATSVPLAPLVRP